MAERARDKYIEAVNALTAYVTTQGVEKAKWLPKVSEYKTKAVEMNNIASRYAQSKGEVGGGGRRKLTKRKRTNRTKKHKKRTNKHKKTKKKRSKKKKKTKRK